MTWFFTNWTPDDSPGRVRDVTSPDGWRDLVTYYTKGRDSRPLGRIVEIAQSHHVRSVVVEQRYIDLDWRSEHASFYGHTFQRYPSICHRLHFFSADVDDDLGNLDSLRDHYCGYSIMRPIPWAPVGRTMIAAPPDLRQGIRCEAEDRVDLFGRRFTIRAMPFVSQDTAYLRCAHSALWMSLYHSHLAHSTDRKLPKDIHDACMGGVIRGRQVPSEGLSVEQMLAGATQMGLSPGRLVLPKSAQLSREAGFLGLTAILCRYVNSQLPPIVVSDSHAWLVVGYTLSQDASGRPPRLWRHDDARGPYLPVDNPWQEPETAHTPWRFTIVPLLPKIYLTAERAEIAGRFWFAHYVASGIGAHGALARQAASDDVTYRTYAVRSRNFKEALVRRGMDETLVSLYQLAHMPRYLWVVEALSRRGMNGSGMARAVLGEAILDATAPPTSHYPANLLALHGDDFVYQVGPDHREARRVRLGGADPYLSGLPLLTG